MRLAVFQVAGFCLLAAYGGEYFRLRLLHSQSKDIPMGSNFYSGTDAELASGSTNAVSIITPSPVLYGITAGIVTNYTTLTTNFNTLYQQAIAPATRTPVVIGNKNVAKKLLKTASADLARIFVATSTVTNAMLLALRMKERVIPTPVPVPATPPVVEVISCSGRLVSIRVHDATSESRGMPFGAKSANIYTFVGPEAPTDPRLYHFEGPTTRTKTQILFPDSVASGATIWISAQWVSARGQLSMGSVPISFTLQGGAIPAAA
jgi:hypothetical protein